MIASYLYDLEYLIFLLFLHFILSDNNESCELTTTVCALEVKPGVLIRVDSNSTPAHFNVSTSERNVLETCTHLVSIIASNKGVDKTPLSLLGSNVESALRENVKCDRRGEWGAVNGTELMFKYSDSFFVHV